MQTIFPSRQPHFFLAAALLAAALLAGCSKQESPAKPATTIAPAQAWDTLATQGKGFTVGAMMSAHTVYVLFDPQCPHCGHLWQASVPLHARVKFVWMPVAFINAKSAPQGAALLAAAQPLDLMATHEASILAGTGGIAAMGAMTPELEQSIKANTELFNRMGGESVPFVVAKNAQTGQAMTHTGAMDTATLAQWLGLTQP